MFSLIGLGLSYGPPVVLGGLVVFVLMRYLGGGKQGVSPVRVYPNMFAKLLEGAIAGNKPMVVESLRKAFEFDLTAGTLPAIIAEWALFEVEQRVKDPNRPAHVIEAIAKFTGLTQEEVFAIIKEDFAPRPAPSPSLTAPVVSAFALATLLLLPGAAQAAYPLGPQEFRPTRRIVSDPPLMRDATGRLVNYESAMFVGSDEAPGTGHYQPASYTAAPQVGFWRRGPWRRVVSAPVRFFAWLRPFRGRRC